jgi:copper chaperone
MTTTQRFLVRGMTCEHCVAAVTEEVGGLPGVESVDIELVPDGVSTLTLHAKRLVADDAVAAAVDEAGYEVVLS